MLVIRLFRVGKKNQPSFKIVVTDKKRPPRAGRFLEEVGFYNPLTKEKILRQNRVKYWLSVGAKPSDTVYNLLISEKIIEGKKIPLHKIKKEKPSVAPAVAEVVAVKEEPAPEKEKKEESKETPEKPTQVEPASEVQKEEKQVKEAAKEDLASHT